MCSSAHTQHLTCTRLNLETIFNVSIKNICNLGSQLQYDFPGTSLTLGLLKCSQALLREAHSSTLQHVHPLLLHLQVGLKANTVECS